MAAVERGAPGVYNVADDEPAPVREWLPVLADALGAGPPRRIPRWLARLVAGEPAVVMGTEARGASNAKAKRELGWTLRYPSWREGFRAAYAGSVFVSHDSDFVRQLAPDRVLLMPEADLDYWRDDLIDLVELA